MVVHSLSIQCSGRARHCLLLLIWVSVGQSVGKDDVLLDHSDSKQSRKSVDLPLNCHQSPCHITFAFRSSEVRHLLLDLDPYGGTDRLGMFPLFLKRTVDVLIPVFV